MSGMDSIGKVWDGYEWVVPEPVVPSWKLQSSLHEPSSKKWGAAAEAFRERQETQKKLVSLSRQVSAIKAQRARVEQSERKQAVGRSVRQERDELLGRAAHAEFVDKMRTMKVEPAEDDLLDEVSRRINLACLAELGVIDEAQASPSAAAADVEASRSDVRQCWVRLAKEMDPNGLGRIGYETFLRVVRAKLRRDAATRDHLEARGDIGDNDSDASSDYGALTSPRRRRILAPPDEIERLHSLPPRITKSDVLSIWRALDNYVAQPVLPPGEGDESVFGGPPAPPPVVGRGYITKDELNAFLRRGMPQSDERQGEKRREKRAARHRQEAQALRDDVKAAAKAAGGHAGDVPDEIEDVDEWQRMMRDVTPATERQMQRLSEKLNERLEFAGYSGWYPLFKAKDVKGAGRIGWPTFCVIARELGVVGGGAESPTAHKASRARPTTAELRDQIRAGANGGERSAGSWWTGAPTSHSPSTRGAAPAPARTVRAPVTDENAKLQRVWRVLDADLTGHITISEFASFFKLGGSSPRRDRKDEAARQSASIGGAVRARVSVQKHDQEHATSQKHAAKNFRGEKSQLAAEAERLEATLREMKRDEESRAYREQREALRAREAVKAASKVQQGGGASTAREQRSKPPGPSLPRVPMTERLYEPPPPPSSKYLEDSANLEHRRTYATFRMISQRMPTSQRVTARGR